MSCCSLQEPTWNTDIPSGKSTKSPFAYTTETCTASCYIIWLHSLFPLKYQKQAELLTICNQETAAASCLCHPLDIEALGYPSSFQLSVLLGLTAAPINKAETCKV